MKLKWHLLDDGPEGARTHGANVPGGILVHAWTSIVFVPGVAIQNGKDASIGYELESTAAEEMTKALGPLQDLMRMFKGMPGIPDLPDPV